MLLALLLAAAPTPCPEQVTMTWARGDTVTSLAMWGSTQLCRPHTVDEKVGARKLPISLSGTVSQQAARELFEAALHTVNVSVVHGADDVKLVDRDTAATPGACNEARRDALLAGILVTGEGTRSISRAVMESDWTDCAATQARVVPSLKDGTVVGFKLFGIRERSVYAALGLSNGDVVMSVNDLPLTTAESALQAYEQVKTASTIRLAIDRKGEKRTLTFTITGPAAKPAHKPKGEK